MLELLWVSNLAEAQSEKTRGVRLSDRCERQSPEVSPFGIIFRPAGDPPAAAPFPTWNYTPDYLPAGLTMLIAEGTTAHEPELIYLPFMNRGRKRGNEPLLHVLPIRRIRAVSVGVTRLEELSNTSRAAQDHGLVRYFESPLPLMDIAFEGPAGMVFDLRPKLPLVFRGVPI